MTPGEDKKCHESSFKGLFFLQASADEAIKMMQGMEDLSRLKELRLFSGEKRGSEVA